MPGGWGHWDASWAWSLLLFAVTIAIHAVGVVLIARGLVAYRKRRPYNGGDFLDTVPESIGIIVIVALILSMLHAIESTIWAVVYVYLGAFHSIADATLYSVDSMTTRGSTGLDMEQKWRMMGATESGNGMLLFGISTAFLFAVMVGLWKKPIDD
ncbi:MAG TPA: hypothetical protein VK760_06375 [Candidatus Acidoferrales bacterium]|jgi:hypothetical protein|nr:hypothetical protein [Candidatus Acidoferrales bacterium]